MEILKVCKKCKEEKPLSSFVKNKNSICGYEHRCKECRNRIRTEKGTELALQRKKMYDAVAYLGGECSRCNIKHTENNTTIFDFHHINPSEKENNISHLKTCSWETIVKELKKCVLLCSNCHRLEHERLRK